MATQGPSSTQLDVTSEDRAAELLHAALIGHMENKNISLSFEDWPTIRLHYEGEKFDGTITPAIAEAIVKLQDALNRTYMRAVHGTESLVGMTLEEKSQIAVTATVEKGSSAIEINLGDFAETLANELVGKMDGSQIVITVLGVALICASVVAWKYYLKSRSEDKANKLASDERIAMSSNETERLKLIFDAQQKSPVAALANRLVEVPRDSFIKSARDADAFTIEDQISLTGDEARQIYRHAPAKSEEVNLNGTYVIDGFAWAADGESAKVSLQRRDATGEFNADISIDALTQEQQEHFKESTFNRAEVYLTIEGKMLHGKVSAARIMSVTEQPART